MPKIKILEVPEMQMGGNLLSSNMPMFNYPQSYVGGYSTHPYQQPSQRAYSSPEVEENDPSTASALRQLECQETGGKVSTRRVRIISAPNEMAAGGSTGYGMQMPGNSYALDRRTTQAGSMNGVPQVNPYGKVGNTLPEAAPGEGNINAEKQEKILGDFDQDGKQEIMNVGGPSHAHGGKDIKTPPHSFVYSDTKDLRIKDPKVLKHFGMALSKKGYTPAQIAAKYPLNKFKKITDNPHADEAAKKTAKLMSDNYLKKLNDLAMVQESMKKHMGLDHHEPNQGVAKYGGELPKAQFAGTDDDILGQNNVTSGYNPAPFSYKENFDRDNKEWDKNWNATHPDMQFGLPTINKDSFGINPNLLYKNPVNPSISYQGDTSFYDSKLGESYNTNKPFTSEQRRNYDLKKAYQGEQKHDEHYGLGRENTGLKGLGKPYYGGPGTAEFMSYTYPGGRITIEDPTSPLSHKPLPMFPFGNSQQQNRDFTYYGPPEENHGLYEPSTDEKDKVRGKWRVPQIDPNFEGNLQNTLAQASLRKFQPYMPVPQMVLPDTVFADPTRKIAEGQELARSAMENANMSSNAQGSRAAGLAYQGEAGKQSANADSDYNFHNVGVANQANQQAALSITQNLKDKADRLTELNKANFLSDRDYQKQLSTLQKEGILRQQEILKNESERSAFNTQSPYRKLDNRGIFHFDSPTAQKHFLNQLTTGNPNSDGTGTFDSHFNSYIKNHTKDGDKDLHNHAYEYAKMMTGHEKVQSTRNTGYGKETSSTYKEKEKFGGQPLLAMGGNVDLYDRNKLAKFIR